MALALRMLAAVRWLQPQRGARALTAHRLAALPEGRRRVLAAGWTTLLAGPSQAAQMSTAAAAGGSGSGAADTGAVVVYVTVPDRDTGRKIAHSLLEHKLAACVNIIPGLESIYVWEGKVNTDEELLLMIKSRQALVPSLTQHVKGLHPYDECEVICLPITGGSPSYLKWVMDSTQGAS